MFSLSFTTHSGSKFAKAHLTKEQLLATIKSSMEKELVDEKRDFTIKAE